MKKIIFTIIVVGILAVIAYSTHLRSLRFKPLCAEKSTQLAAQFDKKTAGTFLSRKHVKVIGIGDFPPFSRDTLYLKVDADFQDESYQNGILLTSLDFCDTLNAFSLLYGIAAHNIQCAPIHYGELQHKKKELDNARAVQYVCDVMRQISRTSNIIQKEKQRLREAKEYALPDKEQALLVQQFAKTHFGAFQLRDQNKALKIINIAVVFDLCESTDNAASWNCKSDMLQSVSLSFAVLFAA